MSAIGKTVEADERATWRYQINGGPSLTWDALLAEVFVSTWDSDERSLGGLLGAEQCEELGRLEPGCGMSVAIPGGSVDIDCGVPCDRCLKLTNPSVCYCGEFIAEHSVHTHPSAPAVPLGCDCWREPRRPTIAEPKAVTDAREKLAYLRTLPCRETPDSNGHVEPLKTPCQKCGALPSDGCRGGDTVPDSLIEGLIAAYEGARHS